jgi:O-acetyl-ADP-ribose deacetylase
VKTIFGATEISILQGDISEQSADVIVNAANSTLLGGGGVDAAIHRAGGPTIIEECMKISARNGGCPPGEAVITTAGNLAAKRVIHAVGPVWRGGDQNEPVVLENCYHNSLALAITHGLKTIMFPSISTGIYDYPVDEAAPIAVMAVREFLTKRHGDIDTVTWVLFDEETFMAYQKALST